MEGRRGMNRGMQTMLLMLAMVASLAVVLLWEVSPFALNASHHGVVLESPIQSFAEPGSDLEDLTKSYEPPSLENTQGDLALGRRHGHENKTTPSDGPSRDSSSSEVGGTDLITEDRETTPDGQSFTDLSQQQNMTGITIVEEKEPTTVAEDKSTSDIFTTNGTQSTNELEASAPLESPQRSNDVAEPPKSTSETENAAVAEKAMSKNSTSLNSNSTLQLEEPTGTENNTVEEVAGQGSDSEKQSSINQNITDANNLNQPQRRRKSSGATQLSDEPQLLENVDDSKVDENISQAVEDGKQAEVADADGPDDNIRENLGVDAEDDEAGFKTDVEKGAHEKEAEAKVCDYTVGTWVLDKTRPLYSGRECTLWLSPDWACRLHNHPDKQMDRYRWQPAGCNLPVFNASAGLETLRNKVVAFVGDSLGRQQWQSLLCMFTHGKNSTPISDAASTFGFYTPRGSRRPTGWAIRFDVTNTTIIFKWSVTLARVEALNKSTNALHLDRPEKFLSDHLHNLDIVILNSGHHWNNGKIQQNGYTFYTKGKPMNDTSVPVAYNQTIHNIVHWIHEKTRNSSKVVYYRSLSPRHFRNGDWNTGGTCDTIQFEEGNKAQEGVATVDANAESAVKGTNVRLLNITALSMERGETHVSKYGRDKGGQDCLHWCLPGVPDTWNEVVLAELAALAEVKRRKP